MRIVANASLVLLLSAPAFAEEPSRPVTRDEYVDTCVRNRESAYECRRVYVDAEIDARRREDPNPGPPLTAEQRKQLRARGIEEITAAGSGPIGPRREQCELKYEEARKQQALPTTDDRAAMLSCFKQHDCAARVRCQIEQRQRLSKADDSTSTCEQVVIVRSPGASSRRSG
jgi:hypothetical protein